MSITLLHTAVLLMCVLWAVRSSKEMLFLPTPHSSAVMYLQLVYSIVCAYQLFVLITKYCICYLLISSCQSVAHSGILSSTLKGNTSHTSQEICGVLNQRLGLTTITSRLRDIVNPRSRRKAITLGAVVLSIVTDRAGYQECGLLDE